MRFSRDSCSTVARFAVVFNFMRSILCTVVILSLWIPQAPAQSAMLLGLHLNAWDDEKGAHPPSYRTFLITFRDGKAQLAADIPELIVPRKDGFWRVGALHKGPPRDGGYQEFIYASPARSVPHAVGEYALNPDVPENPDSNCSPTNKATIEFVNPELLSVSYLTEAGCSLDVQFQNATYKLEELETKLDITTILGPTAWNAEKKADALAKSDSGISPDCVGVSKPDATNWGIERSGQLPRSQAKGWVLASDFNTPHVCGDGDTYEIKIPIPESLTGPTYHDSTLLSLLKSKVAMDNAVLPGKAFLTPSGDFLVALGAFSYGEPVRIFSIKQQAIEPKPALSVFTSTSLGWGFNVVMVQWALGKHVGEWESELQSLQTTHLPEPTVATGSRQGSD
jgi:hypothetical protein